MALAPTKTNSIPESGTVTVACKLPHGLRLRVYDMIGMAEPVMGGGFRESKIARHTGDEVVLNGSAIPFGQAHRADVVSGFGLTFGVSAPFFRRWMEENKDTQLVKNGLVYAHQQDLSVRDYAKDNAELRTGLEPINPDKPGAKVEKMDSKT